MYKNFELWCADSRDLNYFFLLKFRFITKHQVWYRKFAMVQLVYLETTIQDSSDARKHLVAISYDFETVFDTTWRHRILQYLHKWRMKDNLPRLVRHFFRQQKLQSKGWGRILIGTHIRERNCTRIYSQWHSVYNNCQSPNFKYRSKNWYIHVCRWSRNLLFVADNQKIKEFLQSAITNLNTEAKICGFHFSTFKTNNIHFCRLRTLHNYPVLNVKDQVINKKEGSGLLCLIFYKKLYWKTHINKWAVKYNKALNIVRCLSREILIGIQIDRFY